MFRRRVLRRIWQFFFKRSLQNFSGTRGIFLNSVHVRIYALFNLILRVNIITISGIFDMILRNQTLVNEGGSGQKFLEIRF